jgi:hypothetical protein
MILICGVLQLQIDHENERRPTCDSLAKTTDASAENDPFFGEDRIGLLIWRIESKGLTRRGAG